MSVRADAFSALVPTAENIGEVRLLFLLHGFGIAVSTALRWRRRRIGYNFEFVNDDGHERLGAYTNNRV
jgi:hypothetical protein